MGERVDYHGVCGASQPGPKPQKTAEEAEIARLQRRIALGGHRTEGWLRDQLVRLVKKAGVRWLGTHALRRTCGTRIADNGGGINAVAAQLRHRGLQMAARYIDRHAGAGEAALRALER